MKKIVWGGLILLLILFAAWFVYPRSLIAPDANRSYKDLIKIYAPDKNAKVTSPLAIEGEARGFWFFEASFPVRLLDGNGDQIAIGIAQAQSEWMTENYVAFKATLEFSKPLTDTGTLILEKDNPSGLPEYADQFKIPVKF